MAQLPRGIAPELLLAQIRNTMPYLFEDPCPVASSFWPAAVARRYSAWLTNPEKVAPLSHFEYFELCLSAHYLTCGSLVPTDVDNQIRQKLWPAALPLEAGLQMADLVLRSRKLDFTQVTTRCVRGARGSEWENELLCGHLGEWFTVACGAYCGLKQLSAPEAESKRLELLAAISDEVDRHSEIFGSFWRAEDGLGALEASASLAHNFGDLDRVMDMWELSVEDPLRLSFYKLGITPYDPNGKLRYLGRLWTAGELYKSPIGGSAMALENHRHFALRKPRCLRSSPRLLVPTGPFFDDWGAQVAELPDADVAEVVEALLHGWSRIPPQTVGYGRALHSVLAKHPESAKTEELRRFPARVAAAGLSRPKFEALWNEGALRHLEEIPSRA